MPQRPVMTSLFTIFVLLAVWVTDSTADKVYELGRAPQSSATKLTKDWKPYLKLLKDKTNIEVKLRLYPSRDEFEKHLLMGETDFFYANPFYYLIAKNRNQYIPVVRSNAKTLNGIIVTKKDSPINSIEDLNNKTLSFPAQNALGASLYIRSLLSQKGIEIKPIYTRTHENSYLAVIYEKSVASGGVGRTFKEFKEKDKYKTIFTTPGLAPHPLFASPKVPEDVRNAIANFTIELAASEEGKKILKKIKLQDPILANHGRDYEILNDLHIVSFSTFNK